MSQIETAAADTAAAGATTAAAAGEDAAAATDKAEAQPAARPEWLPEPMWDGKAGRIRPDAEKYVDPAAKAVRVEPLFKRAVDAERELTRLKDQTRPAKDYQLKIPEGSAAPEWTDPDHPIVTAFIGAVSEGRLTEAQADKVVATFINAFNQTQNYEMDKLAQRAGVEREKLDARLQELAGRIDVIAGGDDEARATLRLWASSARGVELLEDALAGKLAAKAQRYVAAPGAGAGATGGGYTKADLVALKSTDAYHRNDPAALAKAKEILSAITGDEKAGAAGAVRR